MSRRIIEPRHDDGRLARYFSHFYVLRLGGEDVAIGEAGAVRRRGVQLWTAQVATWVLDHSTGRFICEEFGSVRQTTIQGPFFRLVSKKHFRGVLRLARR